MENNNLPKPECQSELEKLLSNNPIWQRKKALYDNHDGSIRRAEEARECWERKFERERINSILENSLQRTRDAARAKDLQNLKNQPTMKKNIAPQQLGCIVSIFALVFTLTLSFVYYNAQSKKAEYEQKKQQERTYQTISPNGGILE